MKIIIIGAGQVGHSLAEHFLGLGHNVSVVDIDKIRCEQINSKLDVFVVEGVGSDPQILEQAGIAVADIVVAVTPSDEANLLICNFAMQKGVKRRIARVKSEIYTAPNSFADLNKLGVTTVIEPEKVVVEKILQYVELPGVIETANFQSNDVYFRGYRITEDMPIAGKTLIDIQKMAKDAPMLFVGILRDGASIHPAGDQTILPGDEVFAIMPKESFKTFLAFINRENRKTKKVVVFGDTLTAMHLAEDLKDAAEKVILADPDIEHGHMVASVVDRVEVFHGDCTDSEVLQELGVKHADCFIAAGEDSEDNIMSCLLAKAEGAKSVIAIRYNDRYGNLFNTLGVDHVVNPQEITLNIIIEKIQPVSIGTYLSLKKAAIEIIRFRVKGKNSVAGKTLQQLNKQFRKSLIVGCIIRGDNVIIPLGSTIINENDELLVICHREDIGWVSKLFK